MNIRIKGFGKTMDIILLVIAVILLISFTRNRDWLGIIIWFGLSSLYTVMLVTDIENNEEDI